MRMSRSFDLRVAHDDASEPRWLPMVGYSDPLVRGTIFLIHALDYLPAKQTSLDVGFLLVSDWSMQGRLRVMTLTGYKRGSMTMLDVAPDIPRSVAITSRGLLDKLEEFFQSIPSTRFHRENVYILRGTLVAGEGEPSERQRTAAGES